MLYEDLGCQLKLVALHNAVLVMPTSSVKGLPSAETMHIQVSAVLSKFYPLGL